MKYSVSPEIRHKPKEVEEKFTVWEAGGRILATTTKDDAELIVRALNHDEVFPEMAEVVRKTAEFICNCEYTMPRWQHRSGCPVSAAKAVLTKIDTHQKEMMEDE